MKAKTFVNKMASARKLRLEDAVNFMPNSDDSEIDSCNGGMESDEEERLDLELLGDESDVAECTSNVMDTDSNIETDDDEENIPCCSSNTFHTIDQANPELSEIVSVKPTKSSAEISSPEPVKPTPAGIPPITFFSGNKVAEQIKLHNRLSKSVTKKKIKGVAKAQKSTTKSSKFHNTTNNDRSDHEKSYNSADTANIIPEFKPNRQPGIYLDIPVRRNVREVDFFQLFFTDEHISSIAKHTNTYGWMHICKNKKYASKDGAWKETSPNEIKSFIALLLYMGIVKVPSHDRYWSTKSLFHGLWARALMPRLRFKALLAMLHIVDPGNEKADDKLKKVKPFIDAFRNRCLSLFQPSQNLAIDERLVKSKHRSGIRQYIKNKPVKFGIKLWVIADSATGYTCDFNVYTGSGDGLVHEDYGLGYGVVMTLAQPFMNQGFHLFFDNFYTSLPLVNDLFDKSNPSCGTVTENRKGFPLSMKGGKSWGRKYNSLRKCVKCWKTLFFHLVDIAIVNGFILFQKHRLENPENKMLERTKTYALLDFREAVIRQLVGLEEYAEPPVYKPFINQPRDDYFTEHIPEVTAKRGNCQLCYTEAKTEYRVNTKCTAPQCMVYLHLTKHNNCFAKWHTTVKH